MALAYAACGRSNQLLKMVIVLYCMHLRVERVFYISCKRFTRSNLFNHKGCPKKGTNSPKNAFKECQINLYYKTNMLFQRGREIIFELDTCSRFSPFWRYSKEFEICARRRTKVEMRQLCNSAQDRLSFFRYTESDDDESLWFVRKVYQRGYANMRYIQEVQQIPHGRVIQPAMFSFVTI